MYKTVHAYIFVDFHLRQLRRMQSTGYTVVRRVLPTHRIIFRYLFADQRFRWKSRLAKEPRDLRHKTSSSWLKGVFSRRQHCRICLASFSISSAKQAWIFFSMTNNNFVRVHAALIRGIRGHAVLIRGIRVHAVLIRGIRSSLGLWGCKKTGRLLQWY